MRTIRRTRVFGPAYLDRVLRVDRPLLEDGVLDGSFEGRICQDQQGSRICDEVGGEIQLRGRDAKGNEAIGRINLRGRLSDRSDAWSRPVDVVFDGLELGGMGAGFAAAFGGELISALGPVDQPDADPVGVRISALLAEQRIRHRLILVSDHVSDWTLIVSSGGFGDKLAIGFRGCHAAVHSLRPFLLDDRPDLLVVAALPNRLVSEALDADATVRFLAPAMRNMRDMDPPLADLAGRFDILSCNLREWDELAGRETILARTPLVAVTNGPLGCQLFFHDEEGTRQTLELPAFARESPPRDTNRAGEAFASTLITTLLDSGWMPGPTSQDRIHRAGLRGSVAAALVLDREDFGFPDDIEIDAALEAGKVAGGGPHLFG